MRFDRYVPMEPLHRLYNVPQPEPFEAFSCWLTRLGLSQCMPPRHVARHLEIASSLSRDVDRETIGHRLQHVRDVCGLPETAFEIPQRIMATLSTIWPVGERYLAVSHRRPRFRSCPCCLREMHTPHFPIHWRFVAWRWCPIHDCLLEDECPHCGHPVGFPKDFDDSFAGKHGHVMLNRCMACAKRLNDVEPCFLQAGDKRLVSISEQLKLDNGRALLAALHEGKFEIRGRAGRFGVAWFREIERQGAIATRLDWLRPMVIRRRRAELEARAIAGSTNVRRTE